MLLEQSLCTRTNSRGLMLGRRHILRPPIRPASPEHAGVMNIQVVIAQPVNAGLIQTIQALPAEQPAAVWLHTVHKAQYARLC
jgi:hypothetical protein